MSRLDIPLKSDSALVDRDKFHKAIVKADGYADFGILVDADGVTIREARYVRIIKQYMEDRETHIDNIDKLTSAIIKYQTQLNELDAACGERDYYKGFA